MTSQMRIGQALIWYNQWQIAYPIIGMATQQTWSIAMGSQCVQHSHRSFHVSCATSIQHIVQTTHTPNIYRQSICMYNTVSGVCVQSVLHPINEWTTLLEHTTCIDNRNQCQQCARYSAYIVGRLWNVQLLRIYTSIGKKHYGLGGVEQ